MSADVIRFTKGHGTRNDFVLILDEAGEVSMTPALVRALCDRRSGIGADGVIRAVRVGAAGLAGDDAETIADQPADRWFMDYRNADGSTSEMCGNGARVLAAFLERDAGEDLAAGITVATRGGERTLAALGEGRYSVRMGTWRLSTDAVVVTADGLASTRTGLSVDVGNPHVVVEATNAELAVVDLSSAPALTPAPANGANVEFVAVGATSDGIGHVTMRVHERGVGETESCGTGACAVALAAREWAGLGAPDVWNVDVPGGRVTVRVTADATVLEGPAVLLADGVVAVDALTF